MTINTISWNEETKMYEIQNKIDMTEDEFNKLIDELFNDKGE